MAHRMVLKAVLLALCAAALLSVCSARNKLIIFGDSLSDNGNLFALDNGTIPRANITLNGTSQTLYWNGRFTSNPGVWGDQLAARGDEIYNFAFGGATAGNYSTLNSSIPTILQQVQLFLYSMATNANFSKAVGNNATAVFFIGSNDILVLQVLGASYAYTMPVTVPTAISAAATVLLQSKLVKGLMIATLAPVDATPFAVLTGYSSLIQPLIGAINAGIAVATTQLQQGYPNTTIALWDIDADLRVGIANHTAIGYKYGNNVTCLNITSNYTSFSATAAPSGICSNPYDYLFYDSVHPTAHGHTFVADSAVSAMSKVGLYTQARKMARKLRHASPASRWSLVPESPAGPGPLSAQFSDAALPSPEEWMRS